MNKIQNQKVTFFEKRKGAIAVLFAVILPVQLVILGFCIDFANMQRVRNEGRVIADLASKAAADALARSGGDTDLAIQTAQDVAAANTIGNTFHTLEPSEIIFGRGQTQADGSVEFQPGTTPFNSVRVNAIRTDANPNGPVPLFFGAFYGQPEFSFLQTATSSFRDVELCLVLDRSVSMKFEIARTAGGPTNRQLRCILPGANSRWAGLDSAVRLFLDELDASPARERIGMVTFASDASDGCGGGRVLTASRLDQPISESTDAIRNALDTYNNSIWFGSTDITAGINEARQHMLVSANPLRDRVIVVLTDGTHRFNAQQPPEAAAECLREGIIVHTITFSDEADLAGMQETALRGGGTHQHAANVADLTESFRRLAGSLSIITE